VNSEFAALGRGNPPEAVRSLQSWLAQQQFQTRQKKDKLSGQRRRESAAVASVPIQTLARPGDTCLRTGISSSL
jgi:hypothetical protein